MPLTGAGYREKNLEIEPPNQMIENNFWPNTSKLLPLRTLQYINLVVQQMCWITIHYPVRLVAVLYYTSWFL